MRVVSQPHQEVMQCASLPYLSNRNLQTSMGIVVAMVQVCYTIESIPLYLVNTLSIDRWCDQCMYKIKHFYCIRIIICATFCTTSIQCFHQHLHHYHTLLICYYVTEQLMVDIERLTSDKADLLSRLQHCEADLMSANECEYSLCSYFV